MGMNDKCEAIAWLANIKDKYIHGGDEEFDECRRQSIDMAIKALRQLKEQEEQIKNRDESLEKAREEIKWLRGMLKEQKAVKPIIYKEDAWMSAFCGNCNGFLYHGLPFMDTEEYPDKPDYCPNCGKKVKWE